MTEEWKGPEEIIGKSLVVMSKIRFNYDLCTDSTGPKTILQPGPIRDAYTDLKRRRVKIRMITEIISENVAVTKELMQLAEVRHLEAISGNFVIADGTDYAGAPDTIDGVLMKLMVSNVAAFVKQQQYFFETLWEKAIPAEQKIAEIEDGIELERTEIIHGVDKILKSTFAAASKTKKNIDNCIDKAGPSSFLNVKEVRNLLIDLRNRGIKLRFITEITPENIHYCKQLGAIVELRHLDQVKGNFGIHDGRRYRASASVLEGLPPEVLVDSTARAIVEQQQYFFELLWSKAIPAEQRVRQLEEGAEPERLELLPDSEKSIELAFEVMNRTAKELLVLFATSRTFVLAVNTNATLMYRMISEKGGRVRVLVPRGEGIEQVVNAVIREVPNAQIKITDANLSTHITIMISDRREIMSWELRDDRVLDPYLAAGVATYSNARSLADSYATIFENLWRITEFTEDLRAANLRLEQNDKAIREFIDITAHELRNPIQPILGLSEILQEGQNSPEQKELIRVIVRNARRLEQLAEDVLDVTRIETGKLRLAMENVDLNELVTAVVQDFQRSVDMDHHNGNNGVKPHNIRGPIHPSNSDGSSSRLTVRADPDRLAQVLANLLSNAVKHTSGGMITVVVERMKNDEGSSEAVISVSDTGSGIDPEIIPRLFEKFVSRSEKGIGLGLYLSKKIIDAHAGRIWAENNVDGPGATFHVALRLLNS